MVGCASFYFYASISEAHTHFLYKKQEESAYDKQIKRIFSYDSNQEGNFRVH